MDGKRLLRCFDWRFLGLVLGLAVAILLVAVVARRLEVGSPMRLGLGVVQAALFGGIVVATVRAPFRMDEMFRRMHSEAIVGAFGATAVIVGGWTFLQKAGAPAIDWGAWIWPLMTVAWVVALGIVGRSYK